MREFELQSTDGTGFRDRGRIRSRKRLGCALTTKGAVMQNVPPATRDRRDVSHKMTLPLRLELALAVKQERGTPECEYGNAGHANAATAREGQVERTAVGEDDLLDRI